MERKSITAEGVPMNWEEAGQGLPLILVHGIPTSPRLWRHVIPVIEEAHCFAWEMVGYGGSIAEGRKRNISVDRQADYLRAWMDAMEIERAVLAGHDLGGGVVQILAARHPRRCAGLFLTNSICYDSWPIPSIKAIRAMGSIFRHLPDAAFKHIFAMLMHRGHDNRERAQESFEEHWQYYERSGGAEAFIRQVNSLDVEDTLRIEKKLSKLQAPARVTWGAADSFQRVSYGERLAQDLEAPMRRIGRGKHFTPEDHRAIVAQEINRLLAEVKSQEMTTRSAVRQRDVA